MSGPQEMRGGGRPGSSLAAHAPAGLAGRARVEAVGQDPGPGGAYLLGVGELRAAERRAAPPSYAEDGGAGGGVRMAGRRGCWKPFLGFRQAFLLEHFLGGERGAPLARSTGGHVQPLTPPSSGRGHLRGQALPARPVDFPKAAALGEAGT